MWDSNFYIVNLFVDNKKIQMTLCSIKMCLFFCIDYYQLSAKIYNIDMIESNSRDTYLKNSKREKVLYFTPVLERSTITESI